MNPPSDQNLKRRLIVALVVGATLMPLNSTMIAVALPAIGESLHVSQGDLTLWLVTSYLLVNIILQSPAGKLGDILGKRKTFKIGIATFTLGVLIAIFVPFLSALAISRVLMAAGGAMILPNAMALLRTIIEEERRSRIFGYFGAMLGASAAIGPLVGGILIEQFGWESIFLVNLPILLTSWVLIHIPVPQHIDPTEHHTNKPHFDFIGMVLLAFSLGVLVIGLKLEGYWPVASILLFVAGSIFFVRREKQTKYPLIDLNLFKHAPFVIGGTIVGLHNLGMYALLFQIPFWLTASHQLDSGAMGQILLSMTLCMVIFSFLGGRLAEKAGVRVIILVGVVAALLGMMILSYNAASESILWLLFALAWIGGGIGLVSGPSHSVAMSVIPAAHSGVAAGVLSTIRYLGGVVGITIISIILNESDSATMLQQNELCFGIYIGVYFLALLLALNLKVPEKAV